MITYAFRSLEEDTVRQLIELSGVWAAENCSYGIIQNTKEDLCQPLAVACDGDRIVGYVFGHFYEQKTGTSCIGTGSACFSVDELYVHPQYRNQGIGKTLFRMMETTVGAQCEYITLSTSTKNYKSVLKLYIEELGMNFHSAFLLKPTANREELSCE